MKKAYQAPELEVVLFESDCRIMGNEASVVDPDPFAEFSDDPSFE